MFEFILLDCIVKLKAERTIYNIYHLLQGKKAAQTLQDRNIFELAAYYGIYRSLSRKQFDRSIQKLKGKGLVTFISPGILSATEKGDKWYTRQKESITSILFLNGSVYGSKAEAFSNSLQLFLQLLTHIYKGEYRFIPIIEDAETQFFIKQVWQNNQLPHEDLLAMIYHDLYHILKMFPAVHAECFVDRLTTYEKIGLSNAQLAQKYSISPHDAHLFFCNIIHYICGKMEEENEFQFIQHLSRTPSYQKELTRSAKKTFHLIQNGYTAEQIAAMRQLKRNTILDHVIEIAYAYPRMEWDSFITREDYQLIHHTVKQLSTKKLKTIKLHLPDSISYFQIKLALALEKSRYGGD